MTDLDDRLRTELRGRASATQPSADLARVMGAAVGRRRRRGQTVAATAMVALLAVVGGALLVRGDEDSTRVVTTPNPVEPTPGQWSPMPDGPLSPRTRSLAFTVGDEVLIFGGNPTAGCPPEPDCWLLDGAAYNVRTDEWRSIADLAPSRLASATGVASGAVLGDRLYLWMQTDCSGPIEDCFSRVSGAIVSYDVSDDRWTEVEASPDLGLDSPVHLTAFGDRLVAYNVDSRDEFRDIHDAVYDPESASWRRLPTDPLRPGKRRAMLSYDQDLYLFSMPTTVAADGTANIQSAVLRNGADRWDHLPDAPLDGQVNAGDDWFLVGTTAVAAWTPTDRVEFAADQSPGMAFDLESETWRDLPPLGGLPMPTDQVGGSGHLLAYGASLDAGAGAWIPLPLPPRGVAEDESAAAWVGDHLVLWGGVIDDGTTVTDTGAIWTAPSG